MKPCISLVVAMDANRLIGVNNALPWHLPADLKHFKSITMGKPILMGRKTYDSIGKPLPGRRNIIITRNLTFNATDCDVVNSIDDAIALCDETAEIMIIGGVTIYQQALPQVDRMYITFIDAEFEGDAWFPEFDLNEWNEVESERFVSSGKNGNDDSFAYRFVRLERK